MTCSAKHAASTHTCRIRHTGVDAGMMPMLPRKSAKDGWQDQGPHEAEAEGEWPRKL